MKNVTKSLNVFICVSRRIKHGQNQEHSNAIKAVSPSFGQDICI